MTTHGTARPTSVGLVQINNSFSGQNYLPLSVGMLQAYAQKHLRQPENYDFHLPIYRRTPVDEAVQQLLGVDLVFFSTYVWNFRISLAIAKSLKMIAPETVIVFGGPHVPDNADEFLRSNTFVDIACHGEGEQPGLAMLESWDSRQWSHIPGVSFLERDGTLVHNPKGARMSDFSGYPSPYLEGVFAPLMDANPKEHWIALWETNRGCPFSCSFCDWGSAVQSKVYPFHIERLFGEIDWFAEHQIEFIFCCDANFGILPRDIDIANYVAETKKNSGYPHALSVQNTKNATERAYMVQKILADAGLNKGVDIALQSIDETTLKSVKRSNISSESFRKLQARFTEDGVETYTDIILGLPGETYESFANGISTIIQNGQHNRIQFNNLSILPNAEMGDVEYQKKYGMITVETKTINVHGSLDESVEEIYETQVLVVGTEAMPMEDWVKARTFSWMVNLIHFDKILQIPLVMVHEGCGIGYRELTEAFAQRLPESFPVLNEVQSFFESRARDIQKGGPEYAQSEQWLNIWWPPDEYMLIKLCSENKLAQFYVEAERLLESLMEEKSVGLSPNLLRESIELNHGLIKLPLQTADVDLDLSYNIWEFYRSVLTRGDVPLENRSSTFHIDRSSEAWSSWDDWCREVIWWGNKKGAYLYGNTNVESQIAGHF